MKKTVSAILLLSLILSVSGCSQKRYGDEIFSCNKDNLLGIKGVYIDDDKITFVFDRKNANRDEYPYGLKDTFEYGAFKKYQGISILLKDDERIIIDNVDVHINAVSMTIVVDVDDIDPNEIAQFNFTVSGTYVLDLEEDLLYWWGYGGDCREEVTQQYNATTDSWSEAVYEVIPCPETDRPSE